VLRGPMVIAALGIYPGDGVDAAARWNRDDDTDRASGKIRRALLRVCH